ncbi:MAG: hypothetical protein KAW52_03395 [candidate division Zixibacteria bacterium]|nr:hypothetical protein [candidate division Zixibacteria bacterium]
MDVEVLIEGMSYEDIIENFPATPAMKRQGHKYSMIDLMRSIIYEEYKFTGIDREPGNVRHFWYTHLKYIIEDVLGLGETDSIKTTINKAWGDVIVSGLVTYEGMNVYSKKENIRHSVIRDSPFANLIIATEKEDLFSKLVWIPQLFNCTQIAGGGQPSRAVSRAFILELKNNKVDIDQDFYMCVISDLDPAGYYIQEAFRAQLEKAIEYYGGEGTIEIIRLFVRKDQVTQSLIEHRAMKCEDVGAMSESAKKAEDTKWEYFCKMTDGGLYKYKDGEKYRAKLELDAFGSDNIERSIIRELLKVIAETSDESMIMIPEIMRIFNEERVEAIEDILKKHKDDWLQPVIDEFLSNTNTLQRELESTTRSEKIQEQKDHDERTEPVITKYRESRKRAENIIDERIDVQEEIIEDYRIERGFDTTLEYIDEQIMMLYRLKDIIDDEVKKDCPDEFDEIERLKEIWIKVKDSLDELEKIDMEPLIEEHEEILADIKLKHQFRIIELEKFRRWKSTLFDPILQQIKRQIEDEMSIENLDYWYRDLEADGRTKPHISLLMSESDALIERDISAWEQSDEGILPVFTEDDLLQKASGTKDENVGRVRRGFTSDFLGEMRIILLEKGEVIDVIYPEIPEFDDIEGEVQELHEKIEKDIENENYKEPDEDQEDDDQDEDEGEDEDGEDNE